MRKSKPIKLGIFSSGSSNPTASYHVGASTSVIAGIKGQASGYVYAPYIPIQISPTITKAKMSNLQDSTFEKLVRFYEYIIYIGKPTVASSNPTLDKLLSSVWIDARVCLDDADAGVEMDVLQSQMIRANELAQMLNYDEKVKTVK